MLILRYEKGGNLMIINFSDEKINISNNSIFLAGPTLRDSEFDLSWRKNACDYLESIGFSGIVYVPEFKNGKNPMDFLNQAGWEREGLMNAGVIVFYIPRKLPLLPGFTTNVEYGMYLAKRPEASILCCPLDSEKNRYLEWLYTVEKPNAVIYRTLEEILDEAVNMLRNRGLQ